MKQMTIGMSMAGLDYLCLYRRLKDNSTMNKT